MNLLEQAFFGVIGILVGCIMIVLYIEYQYLKEKEE
jgi:hypothetical protein